MPIKGKPPRPLRFRFEQLFQRGSDSECWEWAGYIQKRGYGWFNCGASSKLAHRIAYMIYVGSIPDDAVIMHSCDNRKCVNPKHLSIGNNAENTRQAWERDRFVAVRKLSPEAVIAIRQSTASDDADNANRFGVSKGHVADVRRKSKRGSRGRTPGDGILEMLNSSVGG